MLIYRNITFNQIMKEKKDWDKQVWKLKKMYWKVKKKIKYTGNLRKLKKKFKKKKKNNIWIIIKNQCRRAINLNKNMKKRDRMLVLTKRNWDNKKGR
jgi:hypothetical protein